MDSSTVAQVVSYFSIGTNVAMLTVAIKVSRYIGKIEFQHEMMWSDYQERQKHLLLYAEAGVDRRSSDHNR